MRMTQNEEPVIKVKGNRYEKNDLDTDLAWLPYGEQHSAQSTPTLDMPVPTLFSPTMP